jgi:hypothetical protein
MGTKGKPVRPDGIVKNLFGLDIGLWESKDEKTDILRLFINLRMPLRSLKLTFLL